MSRTHHITTVLQWLSLSTQFLLLQLSHLSRGDVGTAAQYGPPYTNTTSPTLVFSTYTVVNFIPNADHPTNTCPEGPTGNISTETRVNDSVKWVLELIVSILTLIVFGLGIWRWCSSRRKKASHQGDVEKGGGGGGDAENNLGGGGDVQNLVATAEVLQMAA